MENMNKVLLVYEDYSEMMNVQSVLKKVGFDVLLATSEFSLSHLVLSFNPDIIVGYGKGPKVSTIGVGRRLKEMPRWGGKVVLIFPAGVKSDPAELAKVRMDMALEAPLEVTRLLQVLANLTNQDSRKLIESMMMAVAQEAEVQTRINASNAAAKKDDQTVFVSGSREAVDSWNVRSNKDLDEFNKMMGIATPAPAPAAAPAPAPVPATALTLERPPGESDADESEGNVRATDGAAKAPMFPLDAEKRGDSDLQMVTGGGASSEPVTAVTGNFNEDPESQHLHMKIQQELNDAATKLPSKVKAYDAFLLNLPEPKIKAIKRKDARKAQKDLKQDWPDEALKSQDELRRRFTKELFKKKD